MNPNTVPVKTKNIVARKTGNECILIPIINNIADMEAVYTLNETALFTWEQIDGKVSALEISELLVSSFEVDSETALKDTLELLEDLKNHRIIT